MKRQIIIIGIIGQWLGLIVSMIGITLIAVLSDQLWPILISSGSVFWGLGTKLKYYTSIHLAEMERGVKISVDDLLSQHNITPYLDNPDKRERS